MAKKLARYILSIGILCIVFALWWIAPKKLLDGVEEWEISYIEVQDGNTGKHFAVTNPEHIGYIMRNLKSAELQKHGMSLGHSGYGYKLNFYDSRDRMLATFTLNSQSNVRIDPFFYICSNKELCTDYIANLESEVIWKPRENVKVLAKMSEEEEHKSLEAVYLQGKKLFEGKADEGYTQQDYSWLQEASMEESIVIVYSCNDNTHGGWGILGVGANISGVNKQREFMADTNDPTKTKVEFLKVSELCEMFGISKIKDVYDFYIGAWNGGSINGLYYLDAQLTKDMEACYQTIEAANTLVHTYKGRLSNQNATSNTEKVYNYIRGVQGRECITGQQESTWKGSSNYEIDYIEEHTGKLPAIRGFDFMDSGFMDVLKRAKAWAGKGGIVTICWHTGIDFASGYNESLKDELDWEKALTPGTPEYNALLEGMDRAATFLLELQKEDIPVLWKPFHEMDGSWFWWSKGGPENFVKLWQLMYSRYTDYWELNNLIWVMGYSGNGENMGDWYPGDDFVDIVGVDSFTTGANHRMYEAAKKVAPDGMPIVYHECSGIPTQGQMEKQGTQWAYFMTWHTEYLTDTQYNSIDKLNEIYNSEFFVTLDELPGFYK